MQPVLPDVDARLAGDPASLGTYEGFDLYPMPAFVRFPVPDPGAAAQWYVDALGFGVMYVAPEVGGVPMMVHLRRRKFQDILLVAGEPEGGGVNLDASGELAGLAERSAAHTDHDGPVDTPYGPRELRLVDPHGYRLVMFEAPERPTGTIDEAMERTARALRT
jgi:catechol 2,3-dioxygenase-like lactoylglutathione lyase family enzyme